MPFLHVRDNLAEGRRTGLSFFYIAAFLSAIAISLVGKIPSFRTILFALAVASAGAAIFFLLRFLRANDEREQQVNYRALTFPFAGTLVFSLSIVVFQRFGCHSLAWLRIHP